MKRSAVVASGVGRRSVGCDNGSRLGFPAQCQEGEVSANFALTGFSEVLKAKLYSIGASCSGVFTL
jgi:hypothetical protein